MSRCRPAGTGDVMMRALRSQFRFAVYRVASGEAPELNSQGGLAPFRTANHPGRTPPANHGRHRGLVKYRSANSVELILIVLTMSVTSLLLRFLALFMGMRGMKRDIAHTVPRQPAADAETS